MSSCERYGYLTQCEHRRSVICVRDLVTWTAALVFYGFALGVLQVPNPHRVVVSRICCILGGVSAIGASAVSLASISDTFWPRVLASFLWCGMIVTATVELFRFASHTQPLEPSAPSATPAPVEVQRSAETPQPAAAPSLDAQAGPVE